MPNATTKPNLAIRLDVIDEHGTVRLIGSVVTVDPESGELLGTTWNYGGWDPGAEYDGLTISAYVGPLGFGSTSDADRGVWGPGVAYSPYRIESARQAQAIARVLKKIEDGLVKIREAEGYIDDADFSTYILRIARVLKIKTIYVRNSKRATDMSGQLYRTVSGSDLQSWVSAVTSDVKDGHKYNYVAR